MLVIDNHFSLPIQRSQPFVYAFLAILRRTVGLNHTQDARFFILFAARIERLTRGGTVARDQNRKAVIRFVVAREFGGKTLEPPNGPVGLVGIRARRPVSSFRKHHETIDFLVDSPLVDFAEPFAAMSRCSLPCAVLPRGFFFRRERSRRPSGFPFRWERSRRPSGFPFRWERSRRPRRSGFRLPATQQPASDITERHFLTENPEFTETKTN